VTKELQETKKALKKLKKKPPAKLKRNGSLKLYQMKHKARTDDILLYDQSGSMYGEKMDMGKEAVLHLMSRRPSLRCFMFGSSVNEVTIEDVQFAQAQGSTHMYEALWRAWETHPDKIVLATDGEPTDRTKAEILREAAEHEGIPICTLGIGTGQGDFDEDFLKELARITGGTYDRVGGDLEALLQLELKIETLLEYKPRGKAPAPSGGVIEL
jgi:Mg-chelatase subunit ChlD